MSVEKLVINVKTIKKELAEKGTNNKICKTWEYSFGDSDIDLGVATIKGRYPEEGYCMNTICKELVFVLEGEGILYFEKEKVSFQKGDAILIDKNEKYYWDTSYCKVSMTCTPAWSLEQYKKVQ